jgi:hypothetical protein
MILAHIASVPNPLAHLWYWFEVHSGTARGGPDPYYNAFSGWISDLGELAILGGMIQLIRHRNCHVKGCWRFGKQVAGTPYLACHGHHPDHKGTARAVSLSTIHDAFHRAKEPS